MVNRCMYGITLKYRADKLLSMNWQTIIDSRINLHLSAIGVDFGNYPIRF